MSKAVHISQGDECAFTIPVKDCEGSPQVGAGTFSAWLDFTINVAPDTKVTLWDEVTDTPVAVRNRLATTGLALQVLDEKLHIQLPAALTTQMRPGDSDYRVVLKTDTGGTATVYRGVIHVASRMGGLS